MPLEIIWMGSKEPETHLAYYVGCWLDGSKERLDIRSENIYKPRLASGLEE